MQKRAVRLFAFGSPHLADQAIGAPRPPFFAVSGNAGHPSEQLHSKIIYPGFLWFFLFWCLGFWGSDLNVQWGIPTFFRFLGALKSGQGVLGGEVAGFCCFFEGFLGAGDAACCEAL